MALTLSEIVKGANEMVLSGVVENIITVDALIKNLPFQNVGNSDHLNFVREKALPTISQPTSGGTITADASMAFDRVTAYVRRFLVDQDIDVLDAAAAGGMVNVKANAIAKASKSIARQFGTSIISGNSNFTATVNQNAIPISGGSGLITISSITVGPGHDSRNPVGIIRYTHSGTTLAYKAPGDVAFGAEVTAASGAKLYSNNPNLWVQMAYTGTPNGNGMVVFSLSVTSSTVDVDGLVRLVPAAQTITASTNGDAITLATLDQLADLVTDRSGPKVYIMPQRTRRAVAALIRAAGGALMAEYVSEIFPSGTSEKYMSYNGIPILCSDWISTTQTQGSSSTATAVYCATLGEEGGLCGIYSDAVDSDDRGMVISSGAGLTVLDVGTVQNSDARRTRVKAYFGLKCATERGVAAATGITS